MVKKRLIVISMFLMVLIPLKLYAQSSSKNDTSSNTYVSLKLENDNNKHNRPKAPSMQFIECWYGDGDLSFDFAIPEGMCNLRVADKKTGFVYNYVFDSSEHADVYVGNLEYADITITTASGHTYTGEILVN